MVKFLSYSQMLYKNTDGALLLHLGRLRTYSQMLTRLHMMEGSCSTRVGRRLLLHSGRLLSYIRLQEFVRDTLALLGYVPDIRTNVRQSYRRFCRERLLFHLGRLLSHSRMLDNTTEALAPLGCALDLHKAANIC